MMEPYYIWVVQVRKSNKGVDVKKFIVSYTGGHGFESHSRHQINLMFAIAQLVEHQKNFFQTLPFSFFRLFIQRKTK